LDHHQGIVMAQLPVVEGPMEGSFAPVADHRLGSWGWIRSGGKTAINQNGA
jgi:hypothetical protein